jgi:hypothetical protein
VVCCSDTELNKTGISMKGMNSPMKHSIFMDSENIDPISTKRKRTLEDDEENTKPKTSRLALSTRTNISPRLTTPLKTSKSTTPKSAPILKPAGRSPPPKSSKSASRRSVTKPRPEQAKRGVARPFSLASALAQTKAPKPAPKAPASWCFDIHVDTEQEEMTNLMQHSTTVLDISDDEGKATDSRGKENIPPRELGIEIPSARLSTSTLTFTSTATATRTPSTMEDRAPLGELNAADYYAEGCNAFSHAVIYDDEETVEFKKPSSPLAQSQQALITTSIASVLEAVSPKAETQKTDIADEKSL